MLEQLKLEESVCDEYLEYLKKDNADSDYLTEVSTLQEEQKAPEVGEEAMLVALIAKQLQMEDNMIRWRKLYEAKVKEDPENLRLINQQYEEERQKMEIQLEQINGVLDLYLTRERQKEIEEKELEMARLQQQEEERRAQENERKIQELEMKIQREKEEQDKRRVQEMQKEKAEYQAKKQQLINAKVEKEKAKQEEIQDQMRKLQKERVKMQKLHDEYIQWRDMKDREKSEKRRKKNQERIKKREEKKEALKLGEDERIIPPKYRDKEKTPSKKLKHLTEQEEEDVRKLFNSYIEDSRKKKETRAKCRYKSRTDTKWSTLECRSP